MRARHSTQSRAPGPLSVLAAALVLATLPIVLGGGAAAAMPPPLELSGSMDRVPVERHVQVFEDASAALDLEAVQGEAFRDPDPGARLDFGHSRSVYWLRFDLANPTGTPLELQFVVDYGPLDRVALYDPTPGSGWDVHELGDQLAASDRYLRVRGLVFPVRVEAGATERFYLRVESTSTILLPLTLSSPERFVEHVHDDLAFRGLFFGALAGLLAYNLFLFASTREVVYLYYSLSTSSGAFFFAAHDGLLDLLSDGPTPWLGTAKYVVALVGSCFTLQFGRAFLQTAQDAPGWDRWLRGLLVLQLATLAIYSLLPVSLTMTVVALASAGNVVLLLPAAVARLRAGYIPAGMYLLSWSPALLLTGFYAGIALLALPYSEVAALGSKISLLSERVLAAFALAYRINVTRRHELELADQALVAERQQQELQAQLRQSQKMEAVGKLAGGIAHDFNNILQVVRGYHELLLADTPEDDERRDDLLEAQNAVQSAAELTRQLMAFSRQQVLEQTDVNPNDLVNRLMRMLRPILGGGLEVRFQPTDDSAAVHVDPNQIEQVLLNLCVNAREAMDGAGTLELSTEVLLTRESELRNERWTKASRYVDLRVRDNGCGIPDDLLEHIFEPFVSTKGEGTGLGLATAYGIVRQHGGELVAESKEGVGSTFHVYLPVVEDAGG